MYTKGGSLLLAALLSAAATIAQDQEFSNIKLTDAAYPKINFNGRLLYHGVGGNDLVWRHDGTNDGIVLHSANFNTYVPSLTGTGASGTWPISITGNAATWSGQSFEGVATTPISFYMLGLKRNGVWGAYDASQIRTFLSMPANGETLQSVMDRGATTNKEARFFNGASNTYIGSGNADEETGYLGVFNTLAVAKNLAIQAAGGNVGIGTTSPATKLDVCGIIQTRNLDASHAYWDNLKIWSDGLNSYIQSSGDENGLKIKSVGGNKILFESKVGIGTESVSDENFNLFVEKGIRTRKIKVDQAIWADYVFDSSYQLRPLQQLERFILENKRLPEVPSTAVVRQEGVDVSDHQALLLKKIEELTLYIIQQNKDMEAIKKRMAELEQKVK